MPCSSEDFMADESLSLLAKEVRGKTLRLIEGIDDRQARFAAPGLNNTILWHAGHALIVVEHLGVSPATGKAPVYPPDWWDKFSWKSNPATVTSWPTVEEVRGALRAQLDRLLAAIEPLSEQQLSKIVDTAKNRSLRYSILHGLHDEAGHQGEMYLLKKMYAKKQ
jgi:hypothetical protein